MEDITKNEMLFILSILKNPEIEFNANSMAKHIGISPMGSLKIARRLEKEKIITSKKLGRAIFYKLKLDNEYVKKYLVFLLKREAELASPYLKSLIYNIKKIQNADLAILFGSALIKNEKAGDIDVLLITNKKKFPNLKKELNKINLLVIKKIHPIYQTDEDLINNIKKNDKPILNAIKGIVIFGEDKFIKLIEK